MRPVNLLPADRRTETRGFGGKGAAWVAVIALIAVVGGAYFVLNSRVEEKRSSLAVRQQENASHLARISGLAERSGDAQGRIDRVRHITGLVDSRFPWDTVLGEISSAVGSGVVLVRITGTVGADEAAGSAGRAGAEETEVPQPGGSPPDNGSTVTVEGCAPTQTDVADFMDRIGSTDGARDVLLQASLEKVHGGEADGAGRNFAGFDCRDPDSVKKFVLTVRVTKV